MDDIEDIDGLEPGLTSADAPAPCTADNRCNRRGGSCETCGRCPRGHLHCYDWLGDIPGGYADSDMVEVQFKNTRKGYYRNSQVLDLAIGDMVAVEAQPGFDVGQVTLTGALVNLQMRKANIKPGTEHKRVFRKARPADMDKCREARAREIPTMIRARQIAEELKLKMKIGDVEYQGDGQKAIFYYIADERVDFRQLIKVLAEAFKVRIEMKQIGARQEAGRIGGIGPCGRPLCCASWMTTFVSVATSAARHQDISLNPQKLAGQCAKLKCCLNFEVAAYVETIKEMPPKDVTLETADATYYHFKTDIFKREITYSTDKKIAANLVTISAVRAFEVIELNKQGERPLSLIPEGEKKPKERAAFGDVLGEDDLTRFDKKKRKRKGKKPTGPRPEGEASAEPATAKGGERGDSPAGERPRRQGKPQGPRPEGKPHGQRPEGRGDGKPQGQRPEGRGDGKPQGPRRSRGRGKPGGGPKPDQQGGPKPNVENQ